jgi:proliferating cell nuclear antigen
MFKAELSEPNILKTSFDAISSIVDEVQIQTDSDGIRLDALDRSHITFVHLELNADLFDEYVCDEPEKINIDTDELVKVLKRSKSDDRVLMSLDEGNLIITFEGEAKRTFKIRLIDIEHEAPSPPELDHPTKFEIPFALLKDSIADMDIFSDKITLMVDDEYFKASAEGEFGDANIEYLHGEKIDTEAKSVFSLEKIREMLKADKFSDIATIKLGNDMPLDLKLTMVSDEGELSFLLAPRIEAED